MQHILPGAGLYSIYTLLLQIHFLWLRLQKRLKSDITNVFALSQLSQELELGLPSHTRFAMLTLQLPVRWKERPNSDTQCIHMYKKLPVRAMLFLYAHFDIPSIQADL